MVLFSFFSASIILNDLRTLWASRNRKSNWQDLRQVCFFPKQWEYCHRTRVLFQAKGMGHIVGSLPGPGSCTPCHWALPCDPAGRSAQLQDLNVSGHKEPTVPEPPSFFHVFGDFKNKNEVALFFSQTCVIHQKILSQQWVFLLNTDSSLPDNFSFPCHGLSVFVFLS